MDDEEEEVDEDGLKLDDDVDLPEGMDDAALIDDEDNYDPDNHFH